MLMLFKLYTEEIVYSARIEQLLHINKGDVIIINKLHYEVKTKSYNLDTLTITIWLIKL